MSWTRTSKGAPPPAPGSGGTAGAAGTARRDSGPRGRRASFGTLLLWGAACLLGVAGGIGAFTLSYAEGLSYLSNDPKACVNCHIMTDQFDSWRKGPHHAVATCNDCHVPTSFPAKYLSKAENGYHHSMGMTFQPSRPDESDARRVFEEPIRIKPRNSRILEANCLRCHGELVHALVASMSGAEAVDPRAEEGKRCVHCHQSVGHGARR
ncbi:MAG: cytochrome c nitrite reductase small subunit [Deltaproteobacteria bacterium]|nr:cytochrome c nitrite reductase small subunit [Deltaproteobacteria bacterium]